MRIGTTLTVIAGVLALSACSTQSDYLAPTDSQQAYAEDVVCSEEVIVGSRLPQKRCTTRAQRDKERDGAQRWMSGDPHGAIIVVN